MKKETPILMEKAELTSISHEEKNNFGEKYYLLNFDERIDFLIDDDLEGVVLKVDLVNNRYFEGDKRGARRLVSFNLVDKTDRMPVMSVKKRVSFTRDDPYATICCEFPLSEADFKSEHIYKVVLKDELSLDWISEIPFHMFGQKEMGHPTEWFSVSQGGIRQTRLETQLYRSMDVRDFDLVFAKFVLDRKRDLDLPLVLPQLELRMHHSDGEQVDIKLMEPWLDDAVPGRYEIDAIVDTHGDLSGIFYVELLCMDYPIAGFVFSLHRKIIGAWTGEGLKPLEEYSIDVVNKRFLQYAPIGLEDEGLDDSSFDKALGDFIKTEEYTFPERDNEQGKYVDISDEKKKEDATKEVPEEKTEEKEVNEDKEESVQSPLVSLDSLTGLQTVKEKLMVYERVVRFNKMRIDSNLPVSDSPLHAMFLGSPGTGKTTVAKKMGLMLRRAGLLSKGHVVVRERATLLGQYYNSEAEKTLEALEKAQGGILFIDEAYQLYQPEDARDPGKFVIETLLTALADDSKRDWMLILAGYPEEMKRMFEMNPGFKSRIPDSNVYQFDDFTESELMEIAERYFERHQYSLAEDAREALSDRLASDYLQKDKSFGNARHVLNMIQTEILPAMAVRVINEGLEDETSITEIRVTDIPTPVEKPMLSRSRIGFVI